jgi:hypothetical protein
MSAKQIETRLEALEVEVARLKARLDENAPPKVPWWKKIAGVFEGDPYYAEAVRLGREYRESLQPKSKRTKKKK